MQRTMLLSFRKNRACFLPFFQNNAISDHYIILILNGDILTEVSSVKTLFLSKIKKIKGYLVLEKKTFKKRAI